MTELVGRFHNPLQYVYNYIYILYIHTELGIPHGPKGSTKFSSFWTRMSVSCQSQKPGIFHFVAGGNLGNSPPVNYQTLFQMVKKIDDLAIKKVDFLPQEVASCCLQDQAPMESAESYCPTH